MAGKKTPADKVIAAFGGVSALAEAINHTVWQIYRWRADAAKGGRGGRVPDEAQAPILAAAKKRGIKLRPADLVDTREATR